MNINVIRETAVRFGWTMRGYGGYEIEYHRGTDIVRLLVNGFGGPYASFLNGKFIPLTSVVDVMTLLAGSPIAVDDDWT